MLHSGDILAGTYQIISEIGSGGTGIIYLAEHLHLRKKVVVKKIKDHFVEQVNTRIEVDILKNLHHTCLPQVYDFLNIDSSIYTVMEYIEGNDLQKYLDHGYTFPEELIRKWLIQLCEVLWYLHSQNPPIFHSDIKPANLMITGDGRIYLIDFNISLDGENSKDIQGVSPWYAAPEQYEKAMAVLGGRDSNIVLDGRMDIYSLGATFYRVMTGRLPSPSSAYPSAPGEETPDILTLELPYSNGLKALISKAMKRSPAARFQNAGQMLKMARDTARMDPLYRWYGRLQIVSIFGWLLVVIASALFLYYGNWQRGVENWQQAYAQLYVSVEAEDETQIVSQGTEILNSFSLKSYLKSHEDKKAEVLHILGDSYFRQGEFEEASEYYEEAWELAPEAEGYCRDYVIALVRDGEESEAVSVVNSPEGQDGLKESEDKLIEAEISWMQGNAESALTSLRSLEDDRSYSTDLELQKRAGELKAFIYETQEDYAQAVEAMDNICRIDRSREVLRKLGQLSVKAASSPVDECLVSSYLNKALSAYEELNGLSNPSYQDRLNLATVRRGLGDYEGSNQVLKEMESEYADEYEIPMWECYNYLSLAREQDSYEKVIQDLKFQYQSAKHEYDLSGEYDEHMEELIDMMNELEKQEKSL